MTTNTTRTGPVFFPKAGRIAREKTNDIRIEIDGRGTYFIKADARSRLIWNEQVRIYSHDSEFYTPAGFARLSRSGKAVMFFLDYSIFMTPLSLIKRVLQGNAEKCVLSCYLDAEPQQSDIAAGLATGFD